MVPVAEQGAADGQRLAEHGLGAVEIAAHLQEHPDRGQLADAVGSQLPRTPRDGRHPLLEERLRGLHVAGTVVGVGQLEQRVGRLGIGSREALPQGQRLPAKLQRREDVGARLGQAFETGSDVCVALAVNVPAGRERFLEKRRRPVRPAEVGLDPADHVEHLGLELGLPGEDPGLRDTAVELLAGPGSIAQQPAPLAGLEEAEHVVGDPLGPLRAEPRFGQRAPNPRRLHRDRGRVRAEEQHEAGGGREPPPVPPGELGRPVRQRVRPRGDRFVAEVPPQILGERPDRLVSLARHLPQRHGHDRVEVAHPKALGLDFEDRPYRFRGRVARTRGGVAAGEQEVQEYAHGVDVGRRGDGLASHLLRRGVVRGKRAGLPRERRVLGLPGLRFEQLGDAEVEQLHPAVGGDQNVRRLDVAVNDQIRVGVPDRLQHLEYQPDPLVARKLPRLGEGVDPLAFDVLQHEIGLSRGRHARVEESRDPRMRQAGERGALAAETLLPGVGQQRQAHELDCGPALESSIAAPGEPDGSHTAMPERALESPGAELDSGQTHGVGVREEAPPVGSILVGEKRRQLIGERRRAPLESLEP